MNLIDAIDKVDTNRYISAMKHQLLVWIDNQRIIDVLVNSLKRPKIHIFTSIFAKY